MSTSSPPPNDSDCNSIIDTQENLRDSQKNIDLDNVKNNETFLSGSNNSESKESQITENTAESIRNISLQILNTSDNFLIENLSQSQDVMNEKDKKSCSEKISINENEIENLEDTSQTRPEQMESNCQISNQIPQIQDVTYNSDEDFIQESANSSVKTSEEKQLEISNNSKTDLQEEQPINEKHEDYSENVDSVTSIQPSQTDPETNQNTEEKNDQTAKTQEQLNDKILDSNQQKTLFSPIDAFVKPTNLSQETILTDQSNGKAAELNRSIELISERFSSHEEKQSCEDQVQTKNETKIEIENSSSNKTDKSEDVNIENSTKSENKPEEEKNEIQSQNDESHQNSNAETQTDLEKVLITSVENSKMAQPQKDNIQSTEEDIPSLETGRIMCKYTDEELEEALKKFIKMNELPPFEMRNDVVKFARRKSVNAMLAEDYDNAEKYEKAAVQLQNSAQIDSNHYEVECENRELHSRLDIAKQQENEIIQRYKELLQNLNEEEKKKTDRLNNEHEAAQRKFEEHWSSDEATLPFSKPSVTLLQLRKQQKCYALAKKFQEAKNIKIKADRLQKSESEIAQRRATAVMKTEYAQLIEKQRREKECWTANYSRKRAELEAKRDMELNANQKLQNQLSKRIENPKVPRKPHVMLPIVTRSPQGERGERTDGMFSKRTRTRYADFKQMNEKTRLDFKVTDIHKVVRPLNSARKRPATAFV